MITDKRSHLCEGTALNTGGAGTYLIGSQYDTGAPTLKDFGPVEDLYFVIRTHTSVTSAGGNVTIQFKLASDDSASVATNGTATDHVITKAFTQTEMAEGKTYAYKMPAGSYEKFLGLLQITGTEAATAGKVDAFFTTDPPRTAVIYPSAW